MAAATIKLPLDLVRLSLDVRFSSTSDSAPRPSSPSQYQFPQERVVIRLKGDRELRGKLHVRCVLLRRCALNSSPCASLSSRPLLSPPPLRQAFDEHINMVLGDCEETHVTEELDAETGETIIKRNTRQLGMLFVRGDIVVHVSPPLRVA